MNNLIPFLLGLPCLGLLISVFGGGGVYLIYLWFKNRKQAEQSQNWLSTVGRVVDSRVTFGATDTDDLDQNYVALIEYEYAVGGITYRSKQTAFGPRRAFNRRRQAEAEAARYPAGMTVTVFYNPENPQEAVLERRASAMMVTLIVGIAFLGVAACLGMVLAGSLIVNLLNLGAQ